MTDRSPVNSDEASGNHQSQLNTSDEVRGQNPSGKGLRKVEIVSEEKTDRSGDLPVDRLRQMLEKHRGDRQLILLQDFPDPDALSSAWTYKLIAQQYEIHSDIIYAGALSHQENITLVKLTGLPLQKWSIDVAKLKIYRLMVAAFLLTIKARLVT